MIEYTSERRCFLIASKGQKFRDYSDKTNIKDIILEEYKLNEIFMNYQKGIIFHLKL